ncbi:hypothetical protein DL95DRAFT_397709 [Leptodontidium sp. 2 PMI_412]|nr:hypothetical protein DL95DRAFT_397709 [Leptodontidium sp. 2 PMI_412]
MMHLVAMTKTLKYWQKDLYPFTSFTPSYARQRFVISPAFATFILFSFPITSE